MHSNLNNPVLRCLSIWAIRNNHLRYTDNQSNFSDNILTPLDWYKMEKAGAIFLPAAGTKNDAGTMFMENEHCCYWTSSVAQHAYSVYNIRPVYVSITDNSISVTNSEMSVDNKIGRSLRFVVDYQPVAVP